MVTWITSNPNYALVEYIGTFPGRALHGNSKSNEDSYCRTPAATLRRIAARVADGQKPTQIYTDLTDLMEEESSSLKQDHETQNR